jgi:PIN domain nuclease of toxin-antitoxin system
MKLLLDTHIWIWSISQPEKLSLAIRRVLQNPKNEIYVSPVSVWEVCHLVRRGRLKTKLRLSAFLDQTLAGPFREAPFTFAVAAVAAGPELPQSDPGDLFLTATASVLGLTLVTSDEQLLACKRLKTNRERIK